MKSMLSWPIPSKKSNPGASQGAPPASKAAATTRSGSIAAQASAYGPPPDQPQTPIRSMPNSSATAVTSAAQSAIERPGRSLEPPYPGRS